MPPGIGSKLFPVAQSAIPAQLESTIYFENDKIWRMISFCKKQMEKYVL